MPKSHFGATRTFDEMQTAMAYGLTPTQWYKEPRWSRAMMLAFSEKQNAMDYWRVEDGKKK